MCERAVQFANFRWHSNASKESIYGHDHDEGWNEDFL